MNQIINRVFTIYEKGKAYKRKVTGEVFQYGQRIYELTDIDTKEQHTARADSFDRMFLSKKGVIIPKGFKGKTIGSKQNIV